MTIKDICDKWSDKLDIKYFVNEKGRGIISPNINNSMRNCNGIWIKILFQDDFLYDKHSLQKQFNYIQKSNNLQWLMTKIYHSSPYPDPSGAQIYQMPRRVKKLG